MSDAGADVRGMLTLEDLQTRVGTQEIDTVVVGFTDHYGRLMGKRYDAEMFVGSVAEHGAHGCDYLLTTDMEMDPVRGYRFANWELGYGDFHLVPDLATLRVATWLPRSALVLCDVHDVETHTPIAIAPRSILRRQTDAARALGFDTLAASELEHYLFRTSYAAAAQGGLRDLTPAGSYLEDYHLLQGARTEDFHGAARRHLKESGVPIENSKGEWGRGQHEVNVRYADTLTMADRHVVFKQCMKELADSMGLSVTFMAKIASNQAGSGCHVHFSLWRNGRNAFVGNKTVGPIECSDEFRWFLGGWIARVPEVMVCYAPTVNSYKRYVDASWAPTRLAWSRDNRTAGFRVVGDGESLRIECRLAGADCNPYLAFAASLASGLDGITNRTEPPEHFSGDIYAAQDLPRVPYTLAEATERFSRSEFAKRAFGADVVEHYLHFFRSEQRAYDMAVTDWEIQRYFERI
ncbi:MAG: glutamine synthetase family protein [Gemmatimonadaceae bacterium]